MPETAEDRANVAKFTFFESFYEAAKLLPGDEGRDFAWKIIQYAFEGTEPDFDGTMAALFALAKPNIDSSIKGRARGGMGGRPKKQSEGADGQQHPQHDKTPSKTTVKTTVETTIKTPSETPMETPAETTMETDMDMDMDRDKEMDRGGGTRRARLMTRRTCAKVSGDLKVESITKLLTASTPGWTS